MTVSHKQRSEAAGPVGNDGPHVSHSSVHTLVGAEEVWKVPHTVQEASRLAKPEKSCAFWLG